VLITHEELTRFSKRLAAMEKEGLRLELRAAA